MNCPKCGSDNISEIIVTGQFTDEGLEAGKRAMDLYPDIRPCELFECEDCKYRWDNLEFEKYLLTRCIKKGNINGKMH